MSGGVGLVQWTPATKYLDWASGKGYVWQTMESNLERILYEVEEGLQWITKSSYPLSFKEFTTSTASPEYLAQAFITNYERPADPTQPARSTQARYWWEHLDGAGVIIGDPGGGGTDPGTDPKKKNKIYHLWLSGAMRW
jgi:N-acetylmuramoyl-L-alanine amidase